MHSSLFWLGFRRMIPLWLGMIPFGAAYAVTARSAGLSLFDTQLMSLIVFSGGAQFGAAGLFAVGAPGLAIVLTTFLINARHFLYGLSLGRQVALPRGLRAVAAHLLTDEAYGVTVASGQTAGGFLLGAELSVFFIWNLSTLAGSLLSRMVPDPAAVGADFVFPLTFLALLIPLLNGWKTVVVALVAALVALLATPLLGSGSATLLAGVLGPLVGAVWTRGEQP